MASPSISRSVTTSSIAGAFKVLCQVSVALIVFPVIVRIGGAGALGSWVLLQLMVGYLGLTHFGIGSALTRAIARSEIRSSVSTTAVVAGSVVVLAISLLLFVVLGIAGDRITGAVSVGLSIAVGHNVIWIMYAAVVLRLVSSVIGAVIAGMQRTDLVQISHSFQLLSFIVATLLFVNQFSLILALATAYLVSYVVEFLFIVASASGLSVGSVFRSSDIRYSSVVGFLRDSIPFSTVDVSLLVREPLLKLAIFWAAGTEAVGYFEIANKVPATIRQGFVQGLSSLMPAFAHLFADGQKKEATRIGRLALLYIVLGAIGALIVYFANAEFVFQIWIGDSNETLLSFTYVCTIWWIVSSLNVPAWWLGIGIGNIWRSAAVVSFHLACSLLILAASYFGWLDGLQAIVLWVLAGVLMQVLLYVNVSRMTEILGPMYIHRSIAVCVLVVLTSATIMFVVSKVLLQVGVGDVARVTLAVGAFTLSLVALVVFGDSRFNLGLPRLWRRNRGV